MKLSQGDLSLVISPVVEEELKHAPEEIRTFFASFTEFAKEVEITPGSDRPSTAIHRKGCCRGKIAYRCIACGHGHRIRV